VQLTLLRQGGVDALFACVPLPAFYSDQACDIHKPAVDFAGLSVSEVGERAGPALALVGVGVALALAWQLRGAKSMLEAAEERILRSMARSKANARRAAVMQAEANKKAPAPRLNGKKERAAQRRRKQDAENA